MAVRRTDRRLILSGSAGLALLGAARSAGAADKSLRAVYLAGNPVQARLDALGKPQGPAVDVAQALADKLGLTLDLKPAATPAAVLDRVRSGDADIGLAAFDPSRAEGLLFSPPYLQSLNQYAVPKGSVITGPDQVDRAGVKVAAIPTDTGGLYLKRTLRNATQLPVASAEEGVAQLRAGAFDVLATNGQRLADLRTSTDDYTILPGAFFAVPQVIAVRLDNPALAAQVADEVRLLLRSGFVAGSIGRWKLTGAKAADIEQP